MKTEASIATEIKKLINSILAINMNDTGTPTLDL